MSVSGIRLVVLFLSTRKTKANVSFTDTSGIFSSLALERLEASGSILTVCWFVSVP